MPPVIGLGIGALAGGLAGATNTHPPIVNKKTNPMAHISVGVIDKLDP